MPSDTGDLELRLAPLGNGLGLTLRFSRPADAGEHEDGPFPVELDRATLLSATNDPPLYGKHLSEQLFGDPIARQTFVRICNDALEARLSLRIRLYLHNPDLHPLRWETLADPATGSPLALDTRLIVSRFLSSERRGAVTLRPRSEVRALVAVAAPADLVQYGLGLIDREAELQRARASLAGITTDVLPTNGTPCTLDALGSRLRLAAGYDILYLVAHGALMNGRPIVYLEQADGQTRPTDDESLALLFQNLHERAPGLVVLASCESAGDGITQTLGALGPRLVNAGVPAVLAMQGRMSQATIEQFGPVFFSELLRDGVADLALAQARLAIRQRDDWWAPVLYTRLRGGRIWREPDLEAGELAIPEPPLAEQPKAPASFVGREADLADCRAILADQGLAVIVGMAGVGKSTLAYVLANELATKDRIAYHRFLGVTGVEGLITSLAGFLYRMGETRPWRRLCATRQTAGRPQPPHEQLDDLLHMLRGQHCVLWFDDYELVENDELIASLVRRVQTELRASDVRLIITSRRAPPLLSAAFKTLHGLSLDDTRSLLAERQVGLETSLLTELHRITEGNAELLTLAITAIQAPADPTTFIAQLARARGDEVERFIITKALGRLDRSEKGVLEALAILLGYAGTRDTIEAVLGKAVAWETLYSLKRRNLLNVLAVDQGEAPDERYVLHAIVREFVYSRWPSRARRGTLHQRAGKYYAAQYRPDDYETRSALLHAATHFERAGAYARAADLATRDVLGLINQGEARALCALLERLSERNPSTEPMGEQLDSERWAKVRVALGEHVYLHVGKPELVRKTNLICFKFLQTLPASESIRRLKTRVCIGMGRWVQHQSPQRARRWLERGLRFSKTGGAQEDRAQLYALLGNVYIALGNYEAALEAVEEGLKRLPKGPSQQRVNGLINQGRIAQYRGDLGAAKKYAEQALKLARGLHDDVRIAAVLNNLGWCEVSLGHWTEAAAHFREALALAEKLGNQRFQIALKVNLAILAMNEGRYEAAYALLVEGVREARQQESPSHTIICLINQADLHLRQGQLDAALPLLGEVERLARETKDAYRLQEVQRYWAEARLLGGDAAAALPRIERAETMACEQGSTAEVGLALRTRGQILRALGRQDEAIAAFKQSLDLLASDLYEAARTRHQWGLALLAIGELERGRQLLDEARQAFEQLNAMPEFEQVRTALQAV